MNIPLTHLMPNVPPEESAGMRFTIESQYDMIVILAEELRPNAAKDSAVDRFMWRLKQTLLVLLKLHGEERYMIDGPVAMLREIRERQREYNAGDNRSHT